jgi:hypothetical protein
VTVASDTMRIHPERGTTSHRTGRPAAPLWPPEVDVILSAMDLAHDRDLDPERRVQGRLPYRVRGELRLFADAPDAPPWRIYTRDADQRGLGFITPHRLPLGYGGWVEVLAPNGRKMKIPCTLFRCRQTVPGWYEGALYFNREQWVFVPEL